MLRGRMHLPSTRNVGWAGLVLAVWWQAGCFHSARSRPRFPSGERFVMPVLDPDDERGIYVPVLVNGKGPFLFQLDTGAWLSTFAADLAVELRLAPAERKPMVVVDAAGTRRRYTGARIAELRLGDLALRDVGVGLFPDRPQRRAGLRVAGLLGMNVLRDLRIEVDLDRGIVVLDRTNVRRPTAEGPGPIVLPMQLTEGRRKPWVTLTIDGHPARFVVDTGASRTSIHEDVAHRLRLPFDKKVRGEARALLSTIAYAGIFRARLGLGPVGLEGFGLRPLPTAGGSLSRAGLLGMDVLGRYRLVIDLGAGQLELHSRRSLADRVLRRQRLARWGRALPSCRRRDGSDRPATGRAPAPSFGGCLRLGSVKRIATRDGDRAEVDLEVLTPLRGPVRLMLAVASEVGTPLPGDYRFGAIVAPPRGPAQRAFRRRVLLPRLPTGLVPVLAGGARLLVVDAAPYAEPCPTPVCTFWQKR